MAMNSLKVVAIDDNHDNLITLKAVMLDALPGCELFTAINGVDGIELTRQHDPDVILLDIVMPGMDGFELLRHLRQNPLTKSMPIIMLTARGTEEDRISGFEYGADDYVTKPFSPKELMLRVKRLIKRTNVAPREETTIPVEFGCMVLDEARFKTTVNGEEIDISATEMKLLAEMIRLRGKALSRRRILELAWGDMPNVTDRTIDTHVKRLRKKLGDAAEYLETVRGVGYRWAEKPNHD